MSLKLEAIGYQFAIVGLQEARSTPGKKFVPGYVLFASGNLNHSLGVETWISIDQAFDSFDSATGKVSVCFVDHDQVCFIYGYPRFLIISFEFFGEPIHVANVHALHQSHGVRTCIAFRRSVCCTIKKHVPNLSKLILLGDLNIKLGGEVSECIGDFASDRPNKVGRCVHEHLLKFHLAVPSSVTDC